MKKLFTLTVCVLALGVAGNALAVIDWAGNTWPGDGADVIPTEVVNVYIQVYKSGVTDPPDQGMDIGAVMYYTADNGTDANIPMTYNTDVGSNDEYTAQIPIGDLFGATQVSVWARFTDQTDGYEYDVTPVTYNVVNVLPVDVNVRFYLCMSGAETNGEPCVIGSNDAIGNWTNGVPMYAHGTPELYYVEVTFLQGSNPSFEYKYKKDGCNTWESTGNRLVTLPTDGTSYVELAADSWEFAPITCGMGNTLEEEKVICFQVCMDGVLGADGGPDFGAVCTVGGVPELDNWGTGVATELVGPDLYQTCIVYPAGTAIPLNIEYKFKKDDCNTWEGGGNKLIVLDNSLAAETTLTHTWEDGPGVCEPVAVEDAAWGTIKGMYR